MPILKSHLPGFRYVILAAIALFTALTPSSRAAGSTTLPTRRITQDDNVLFHSCQLEIPRGLVISDRNGNGVIQIGTDNLTLRFKAGSVLRGAKETTPWDQLSGVGIRINGHTNITIINAQVHGFKNGLLATRSDHLSIIGGDWSDNFRQRLKSTTKAEDGSDWLFPHDNDRTPWREQYGGAICVEKSTHANIRDIFVRRGQNGILLDEVVDSAIYDNDCSFLSGWGLAMWRSSRNVISRNAFDFCVRGHVEGVYNRGQDSAGILCFEQCNQNLILENSVTHGGDGFFGFAGREALGERWIEKERERLRKETGRNESEDILVIPSQVSARLTPLGCNSNILSGNDFSYAAAHGIEMTFSEGNQFLRNRIVENAICGVWGGYSSGTVIAENDFSGNGGMAYGLERGAINMEHAANNLILRNKFLNNRCGLHLWWNNNPGLVRLPGVAGGEHRVIGNVIASNQFVLDSQARFSHQGPGERLPLLQLRDPGKGANVFSNSWFGNSINISSPAGIEWSLDPGCAPTTTALDIGVTLPAPIPLGRKRPVGARAQLRGRDKIILDEWGPWDHTSPLIRPTKSRAGELAFELLGVGGKPDVKVTSGKIRARLESAKKGEPQRLTIAATDGVTSFRVLVKAGRFEKEVSGTLIPTTWHALFFPWTIDPRENLDAWRKLASGPNAVSASLDSLDLPYAGGGPKDLNLAADFSRSGIGADHFGMIARTKIRIPRGKWNVKTLSDDGIRVRINDVTVVENWSWHGPTENQGTFQQAADGDVEIVVEHFEIDGYATLKVDLEPQ